MTFSLKTQSSNSGFYQLHLDRVSRSFAFCIARLDEPVRSRVGLSYLLCRLVDTVEDANWPSFSDQAKAFSIFNAFIRNAPSSGEVAAWRNLFPLVSLPEGEQLLLKDAERFFADFHELPASLKSSLSKSILSMSRGMEYFMKRKSEKGELRLTDLEDVNRYCFFVAGVVGEMLTHTIEGQDDRARLKDSYRFGLFLQKVNILKDQVGDEEEGRHLVPSRQAVLKSCLADADIAYRYLKTLPNEHKSFRLFCAWCLLLGLASLPWIERAYSTDRSLKIPRIETGLLLEKIDRRIAKDQSLDDIFNDLRAKIETPMVEFSKSGDPLEEERAFALYSGDLVRHDVLEIFRHI